MSTFTKEQLIARINQVTAINKYRISRDPAADGLAMDNELFAIALASLEAEAMTQVLSSRAGNDTSTIDKALPEGTMLFTAPPAPVVPDEKPVPNPLKMYAVDAVAAIAEVRGWNACRAAMLQGADEKPELTVWYGSMPESNVKANWTAILHRKGEGRCMDGFTIDRSEYPGRVLYAADRVRYLIGEKSERPSILDYDADAHSGYVKTGNSPVIPDGWVACCERMPPPKTGVIVGCWFGRNWATKWATYLPYHPDAHQSGFLMPGGSWTPTHWMPLPAAPQQEVK